LAYPELDDVLGSRLAGIGCEIPPRFATETRLGMVEFGLRFLKGPWATAALICLAVLVILFALAGQTVNALFVYAASK